MKQALNRLGLSQMPGGSAFVLATWVGPEELDVLVSQDSGNAAPG